MNIIKKLFGKKEAKVEAKVEIKKPEYTYSWYADGVEKAVTDLKRITINSEKDVWNWIEVWERPSDETVKFFLCNRCYANNGATEISLEEAQKVIEAWNNQYSKKLV